MRISNKKLLIGFVGVLVLFYGLWQARDFLRGPRVYIKSPEQGGVFDKNPMVVKGQAFDIIKFTLNGRTIFTDENGNFREEILLAKGVNDIEIYAEDKFGHEKRILRTVLLR